MFETFILAVVMVMVLIAGMSIGVIFGRKPISGSCGGVGNQLGGGSGCSVCGRESGNCGDDEDAPEVGEAERLTYSADSDRKA
ncbi:MAG: (Na+)-NQR maturation NqrM [Pseudomonadota bacterium]